MEQPNGNPCPECGAPRHRDNTPSCACTLRASEALRDARTAEAAAAEDFDPLRIRPYVELDGKSTRSTPDGVREQPDAGAPADTGPSAEGQGASGAPDETMALRAVPPEGAPDETMALRALPAEASPDETMALRALPPEAAPEGADATSVLPTPLGAGATPPSTTDLNLFDGTRPIGRVPGAPGPGSAGPGAGDPGGAAARRRRRGVLFAVAGAVVTVVGAAGWASGMFSYETPTRSGAAPEEVRAGVPDASSGAPSAEPTASASSAASPTASASPSDSPSASASANTSASPSPSESSTSPTPSAPAEPSPATTPPSPAAGPPEDTDGDDPGGVAPVLRRGDSGPEVVELQQRLQQVYLYHDDIHGRFTRRVEDAVRHFQWYRGIHEEPGVYGPQTRARLEAETGGA
ncbi:peptidoglycan-binding protein [Streptomyces sp. NPDC086080]|uniref:peptidoglycan-binding protein n=1 Tax=Streptomyces sp. NPDC086080 TaxID=3365748 RepID=UPI0037D95775